MKTCFLCKHCEVDVATGPYSEYTPGDDWTLSCNKHHFFVTGTEEQSGQKWHDMITKAETCDEFTRRDR